MVKNLAVTKWLNFSGWGKRARSLMTKKGDTTWQAFGWPEGWEPFSFSKTDSQVPRAGKQAPSPRALECPKPMSNGSKQCVQLEGGKEGVTACETSSGLYLI